MPSTRFGGIAQGTALAVIILTVFAAGILVVLAFAYRAPPTAKSAEAGDLAMYARVVDHVRHGEGYYTAAHRELLAGGFGTRSVFNWRLPALPWAASLLPSLIWMQRLVELVVLAGIMFAFVWLDRTAGRVVASLAATTLSISFAACLDPDVAIFADVVAGVLILLSVTAYGVKLPGVGFLAALLALFIRELAGPYVVVCIFIAWREGRVREVGAWLFGLAAFAAYFAWHYFMTHAQLTPGDHAYPGGWLQFGGLSFVLSTAAFNGLLLAAPLWLSAIILPLSLVGIVAWRDPGANRVAFTVGAYLILFLFIGKPFDDYWGALYTPLMMLGLAFLPAAIRDLAAALRGNVGGPRTTAPASP